MNNKEITRHKANHRAALFMDKNSAALSALPIYANLKIAFDVEMNNIHKASLAQAKRIKPITKNKNKLRAAMADTMVKFLQRAAVQSHTNNNIGLVKAFTIGKTYFTRGTNSTAPVKARNLKNLMVTHHSELPIITNDDLDEMETAISKFEAVVGRTKEAIIVKKVKGTDIVLTTLRNLDEIKDQIGKLIGSYLPELAPAWFVAIKVGHSTAIRHLSLETKIVDAEMDIRLRNIKCTLSNSGHTLIKYSTRRGSVRFKGLSVNTWTVTIEGATYETQVLQNIATQANKVRRLHIRLVKLP